MTQHGTFGAETTTDEVLEGVDLSGRLAVVTGGYGGLGRETARTLAAHGADVVIAGRDPQRLADTAAQLTEALPAGSGAIETSVLDLASLDSVRAAAAELTDRHPEIHLLIDNAGVMACPPARTADGFEMQFGTNHLGHFLFTVLLLDALRAGAPSRVVVLSSAGHRVSPIRWDDPNFERSEYHNWTAYGQSKTANALFALELDRRLSAEGVHAYSVHPGVIMTELGRHMGPADFEWMAERARRRNADTEPAGDDAAPFTFKSAEAGAATSVWAATAPELAAHGGAYLEDCGVAEVVDGDDAANGVAPWAVDAEQASRLWDLSCRLVGATDAV
jgi:NAD(P)-dependent dehydrogenase (short-subunit alcohol dehydrogenase family)